MSKNEGILDYNIMSECKKKLTYNAWLHWTVINRCNMNCEYCFFHDNLSKRYGRAQKIDIPRLIKTLDKTSKVFRINFVGGEPFLVPNIIEACIAITKKHFVSFNTNLTSTKIKEFSEKIDPKRVIIIGASLHIKELEKYGLTDRYVTNFLLCKKKGFNIFAPEIAYPPLLKEAEKYREFFKKRGIRLEFDPFIGKYDNRKYPESYTAEEIKIFGLKKKVSSFNQKGQLCNAGYNVGIVFPNGDIYRCYFINDKLGNVYKEIKFGDKLIRCPIEFCGCPVNSCDTYLFKKALKEDKIREKNIIDNLR